jgi:molybdenum cofactor cytidylyltransferase
MSEDKPTKNAILILAAGSSSRMGQPKQLLPWQGKTLVEHSVDEALTVSSNVFVVLGAHLDRVQPLIQDRKVTLVENTNWEQGMGTSIARGIRELEKNELIESVLIMLVDQPFLNRNHLNCLFHEYENSKNSMVCTQYDKKLGVPAVFHRSLFQKLKQLNNDFGARHLIAKRSGSVASVVPKQKVTDIDTQEKYNALYNQYGKQN